MQSRQQSQGHFWKIFSSWLSEERLSSWQQQLREFSAYDQGVAKEKLYPRKLRRTHDLSSFYASPKLCMPYTRS
jgi:hypothetical protein